MRILRLLPLVCAFLCSASPGNDTAWKTLIEQAENLIQEGRYEEARTISDRTLQAAKEIEPSGFRVAVTLNQIGLLHSYLGDYSKSEKAYLHGIRLLEDCACESLHLSRLLDNLASLYLSADTRHAQVEKLRRRALDLCITELGPQHPDVGILLSNLGATAMAQHRFSEAEDFYQQAITLLESRSGSYAANFANVLANRAVLSFRLRRYSETLADLTRAVEIYENTLGARHQELVRPLINLARLHLQLDQAASAEHPLRRAMLIAETTFGPQHPIHTEALSTYAVVLRKTGRKRESRETEKRIHAIRGMNPQHTANMTVHIGDLIGSQKSILK